MADEAQRKDYTIKDSRLDAGGDIHIGDKIQVLKFIVQLTDPSGMDQTISDLLANLERQGVVERDLELRQGRHIASLERTIDSVLQNLGSQQRQTLIEIMSRWVKPVIEKYKAFEEHNFQYAEFCKDLIRELQHETSKPGARTWTMAESQKESQEELQRTQILEKIFTTPKLMEQLNSIENGDATAVYLEYLTRLFPQKSHLSKPSGFYLLDRTPYDATSATYEWDNFCILCVANSDFNGWATLLQERGTGPKSPVSVVRNAVNRFSDGTSGAFEYYIEFRGKDVLFTLFGERSKTAKSYVLELNFEQFSAFLVGFVADFLNLSSRSLFYKKQFKTKTDNLFGLFSSDK